MGKLVRDLIPDLILAEGGHPDTRVLDEDEYVSALHRKLLEEGAELRAAPPDQRLEEAADVYEVLSAMAAVFGFDMPAVVAKAEDKRSKRGGFHERIWLD